MLFHIQHNIDRGVVSVLYTNKTGGSETMFIYTDKQKVDDALRHEFGASTSKLLIEPVKFLMNNGADFDALDIGIGEMEASTNFREAV